jgi:uncharacterized protein (TIGR02594 family)
MPDFSLIGVLTRLFQKRAGARVDDKVGSETAKKIDAAINAPVVAQPASGRPAWLEVSLSHLGMKEGQGAADNAELVADIRTVAKDYQHDATPWCAGWVSFCLAKAGEKPTSQPLWALSYSDTKNQPVVKLAGPAVGAIAVKTRNGGGHVTFVAGRTSSGALACCGGNQNDEVNVSPYLESVFIGFYWPKNTPLPQKIGINNLPIVSTAGKPVMSEA